MATFLGHPDRLTCRLVILFCGGENVDCGLVDRGLCYVYVENQFKKVICWLTLGSDKKHSRSLGTNIIIQS